MAYATAALNLRDGGGTVIRASRAAAGAARALAAARVAYSAGFGAGALSEIDAACR